ncbi:MAG: hypothetical protein I8H91_12620 [Burkholderiales bacterium]|nr:hypothetical protein [Burkholderiales bacterium]
MEWFRRPDALDGNVRGEDGETNIACEYAAKRQEYEITSASILRRHKKKDGACHPFF